MSNTIRAFVALNLPIPVIRRVAELQRELRNKAKKANIRVGWVPPPNLHVTLKFLGNIPAENAWAISDRLKQVLAARPSFGMQLQGTGAFPNRAKPRVLWLGLKSAGGELEQLAEDMEQWFEELGFAREQRDFHPHLTLGRVKSVMPSLDLLEGTDRVDLGRCSAAEVVLYESLLNRRGAEYSALARIPLVQG